MEFNFNGLLATSYASHFHYNLFFDTNALVLITKVRIRRSYRAIDYRFVLLIHRHKEYWLDKLNVPIKAMFSSKKDIKKTIAP